MRDKRTIRHLRKGPDRSASRLIRLGTDRKKVRKCLRYLEQMLPCEDWPYRRARFSQSGVAGFALPAALHTFAAQVWSACGKRQRDTALTRPEK